VEGRRCWPLSEKLAGWRLPVGRALVFFFEHADDDEEEEEEEEEKLMTTTDETEIELDFRDGEKESKRSLVISFRVVSESI